MFGKLFERVQSAQIFSDSKTFADAIAKFPPETILDNYKKENPKTNAQLESFIARYFRIPASAEPIEKSASAIDIREHIEAMWNVLQRREDKAELSSLIPLPYPYIVPGGRFREIYYWDSYFTLLGLEESGHVDLIENMVRNFAHLIDSLGMVPNGNRTYYSSRSQPPYFAAMVDLLANAKNDESIYIEYLPQLEAEYKFWMAGADRLKKNGDAHRRTVRLGDTILNRHWDDNPVPRQESYHEDLSLAAGSRRENQSLFRDIRAACETGWDFSSRWMVNPEDMRSIRTTDVVPVDLNCILFWTESVLTHTYSLNGNLKQNKKMAAIAETRRNAIGEYFYDPEQQLFTDLLLPDFTLSSMSSLASAYPLFCGIASQEQAAKCANTLEQQFLKPGGWVTTPRVTGQQWDAPNGWAPMQWIVYQGLSRFGFSELAAMGAGRWVANNLSVFEKTGSLFEKYNVENPGLIAGGGEYEVQHGFGWTNAVLLKFMNFLGL